MRPTNRMPERETGISLRQARHEGFRSIAPGCACFLVPDPPFPPHDFAPLPLFCVYLRTHSAHHHIDFCRSCFLICYLRVRALHACLLATPATF